MASSVPMRLNDFQGFTIPQREEDGYFYVTPMAQAVGKRWNDYTRTQQYNEYIQVVASKTGIPANELIQAVTGHGSWAHPYIAVDFASWCNAHLKYFIYQCFEDWLKSKHIPASIPIDPVREKIANLQALADLCRATGRKVAANFDLAIEALTGEAAGLPIQTLKERDLHYAEHFWSEKRKDGWRTHYATQKIMIVELGKAASQIMRERGLTRVENMQTIHGINRMADVGLYPWEILEEALRRLVARTKAYRLDKALGE